MRSSQKVIFFNGISFQKYNIDFQFDSYDRIKLINHKLIEENVCFKKNEVLIHSGFCDSHIHSFWEASLSGNLNLVNIISNTELQYLVENFSSEIVTGYGWDENKIDGFCVDFVEKINKPIYLLRVCGHQAIVNKEFCNIHNLTFTKNIVGDEIILKYETLKTKIPNVNFEKIIIAAQESLLKKGINSISEMSVSTNEINAVLQLLKDKKLNINMDLIPLFSELEKEYLPIQEKQGKVEINVIHNKWYLDGSFGAKSARLRIPYKDSNTKGNLYYTDEKLFSEVEIALKKNFLLSFHAIGDGAIDQIIRLSQYFSSDLLRVSNFYKKNFHRIEHLQLFNKDQELFFTENNLWEFHIQPFHRIFDAHFFKQRLGVERVAEAYSQNFSKKIKVYLGSDSPIGSNLLSDYMESLINHPCPTQRYTNKEALEFIVKNNKYSDFTIKNGKNYFLSDIHWPKKQ